MSAIMTKWVVQHEHPVAESDLDAAGAVRPDAVQRWIGDAWHAYLDLCPAVRALADEPGSRLVLRPAPVLPGEGLGRPELVVVTASVTELRPASFTVSARLRPVGGVDAVVTVTCAVLVESEGRPRELGTAIRDELIALEHAARYYN